MGNNSSVSSGTMQNSFGLNTSKCNTCSQSGSYFSFGKSDSSSDFKSYILINGKERRVYSDSRGRYYHLNSKKKYLPKGTRTFTKKPKRNKISPQRKKNKGPQKRNRPTRNIRSPLRKVVKDTRNRKIGMRLSARAIFNETGMRGIGKSFNILQPNGTYKVKFLRLRQNGSPYFSNKFGVVDKSKPVHLKIPYNRNWLRGPPIDNMTGLKDSWPTYGYNIPPGGVAQQLNTSLLPRVAANTHRGNNFGNVPHMHYGKMCFGA